MVKVRHDNIVTFYGGCVQHPDIIMVNERCDDSTLQVGVHKLGFIFIYVLICLFILYRYHA